MNVNVPDSAPFILTLPVACRHHPPFLPPCVLQTLYCCSRCCCSGDHVWPRMKTSVTLSVDSSHSAAEGEAPVDADVVCLGVPHLAHIYIHTQLQAPSVVRCMYLLRQTRRFNYYLYIVVEKVTFINIDELVPCLI